MVGLGDAAARLRLRVLEGRGDVVHRRARDARLGEAGEPVGGAPCGEGGIEDRQQLVAIAVTRGEVGEALLGGELGPAERRAERLPELLLRAGDDDPAVGGGEVLERHDRRVR